MSRAVKHPIPPGFVWDHVRGKYVNHTNGRTWDDRTNTTWDKDGNVVKTTVELNIPATAEERIQALGLTKPRVTPQDVDAAIKHEEYIVRGVLTICILTLQNGHHCIGESACVSPENFNADLGRDLAKTKAKNKIWELLGYQLRERLNQQGA